MAESFVQVNEPTTLGDKLKAFETTDGNDDVVKAQATVLTDGATGEEKGTAAAPVHVVHTSSTATRTQVTATTDEDELLPENAARRGAVLYNNSQGSIYIGLGDTEVTTDDFTYILAADTEWPVPAGFTGAVRGFWSTEDSGKLMITELT